MRSENHKWRGNILIGFHLKETGYGKIKIDLPEISLTRTKRLRAIPNDRLWYYQCSKLGFSYQRNSTLPLFPDN